MGQVKITRETYEPFGNCVKLTNGVVELYVTVEAGPRVIHFSLVGKENVFYNDKTKKPLGDKFDVFGGNQLRLLGGHRIWVSPEIMPRCYHPDDLPVTVKEFEGGAEFAGAVEAHNQIQKIMRITLREDSGGVTIEHVVKNVGLWEIELAPWCVTMLAPGGVEVMPQVKEQTGLLPNRNFSLWAYSEMSDPRVTWGKDYITLRQDVSNKDAFKLGYNNITGWSAYFNCGQAFIKFFDHDEDGVYPDNGCNFESYTDEFMLESESLGQITLIPPGEEILHMEEWEIYECKGGVPEKASEVGAFVAQYIER